MEENRSRVVTKGETKRPLTCPSFHCHASNKWVEQISQNYINSINNEKKYHYLSMSCFSESLNFCLGIQFLKTSPIFMYMSNLQHMNRVFYWSLENSSPTETILYMLTQLLGWSAKAHNLTYNLKLRSTFSAATEQYFHGLEFQPGTQLSPAARRQNFPYFQTIAEAVRTYVRREGLVPWRKGLWNHQG